MQNRDAERGMLASHLRRSRPAILKAWRDAVTTDPALTTGTALPRPQLHDHIPALLELLERRLAAQPCGDPAAAEQEASDAAAHGLQRWQQGYDLQEVTRELGKLNEVVVRAIDDLTIARPFDHELMSLVRQEWATLFSDAVGESTTKYFDLQQLEAASHVKDLEAALNTVRDLERQRAELWQQAAHDLRGNLGVVANAAAGLTRTADTEPARATFMGLLARNVASLHHLLDDVTSLARLQAGQEQRRLATVDAASLLKEVCDGLRPLAEERGLFLHFVGPASLVVQGDAVKVRRIAQNLVLNAIKYTHTGGVTVTWGDSTPDDAERWRFSVADTGPGFHAGPGAALAGALEDATEQAQQVTEDARTGSVTHADENSMPPRDADRRPVRQAAGEGIGLSIVKRLCELLNATVELESRPGVGTEFRIVLPRSYGA